MGTYQPPFKKAKMENMGDEDDIPDHLVCPVCFDLPSKEVYQCQDGHVLCSKCYFTTTLKECPQCRRLLNKEEPIRNRHFEGLLEGFVKVECCFKSNGCTKKVRQSLIEDHQKGCWFDTKKFGKLTNFCKLMNNKCNFSFNNGNTEEVVAHFTSVHDAKLVKKGKFRMELMDFKRNTSKSTASEETVFWTPIIADLKEKKSYLFAMAVYNKKDDSFAWYSLYLPYPNSRGEDLLRAPFEVEWSVSDGHLIEPLKLSLVQEPLSISKVTTFQPINLPRRIKTALLNPYITEEGNLFTDCKVRGKDIMNMDSGWELQSFKCLKIESSKSPSSTSKPSAAGRGDGCAPRWDRHGGSIAAKNFLEELIKECNATKDRNKGTLLLQKIFSFGEKKPEGVTTDSDLQYLKDGAVFVMAVFGDVFSMSYFTRLNRVNINMVNGSGCSPLHCTFRDKDCEIGLDKAKALVEKGANVKALDDKKLSVLHWAAWKSSDMAVDYFLKKGLYVNALDKEGKTPLHYAMMDLKEEFTVLKVIRLLDGGANWNIQDKEGNLPLDIAFQAKSKSRYDLRNILQSRQKESQERERQRSGSGQRYYRGMNRNQYRY